MTDERQGYRAEVRIEANAPDPGQRVQRIVVEHHRAPRVAWSVDRATGGHMLHLALAQCVFNNVLRVAAERGLTLNAVTVAADGGFDADGTASTGIDCSIELFGDAAEAELAGLADVAFEDSTVVAVLRRGGRVDLASVRAGPPADSRPSIG